MDGITRVNLEIIITELLEDALKSGGGRSLRLAIDISLAEFHQAEEMRPLLRVVYDSCTDVDDVLTGWANILDDYTKVCK